MDMRPASTAFLFSLTRSLKTPLHATHLASSSATASGGMAKPPAYLLAASTPKTEDPNSWALTR